MIEPALSRSRALWNRDGLDLRSDEVLAQLLDRGELAAWRALYRLARQDAELRQRIATNRKRGPISMLAVTIALEHFTAMMAETHARHVDLFDGAAPGIERMWRWHAMEETEHKAVAYDVFLEVTRHWSPLQRYLRRCISMAIITFLFTGNITRYAARLLEADGYTPEAAIKAVKAYVWRKPGIFSRGWKSYFAWFRPGFHPWDQDTRSLVEGWKADFETAPVAA